MGAGDGKVFVMDTGDMVKKADGKDTVTFRNGKFHSQGCDQYGFGDAVYTTATQGDAVTFAVETSSPKRGKIQWEGDPPPVLEEILPRRQARVDHPAPPPSLRQRWDTDRPYAVVRIEDDEEVVLPRCGWLLAAVEPAAQEARFRGVPCGRRQVFAVPGDVGNGVQALAPPGGELAPLEDGVPP